MKQQVSKWKRIGSWLLALCLVLTMLPMPAQAAEVIASGICGDNLTWELTDDGKLTISGTGNMYDYTRKNKPWSDYIRQITSLEIESGVKSISPYAFLGLYYLTEVVIGKTLAEIGSNAFNECYDIEAFHVDGENKYFSSDSQGVLFDKSQKKLIQVPGTTTGHYVIADHVQTVWGNAFRNCRKLSEITVGSGVTEMGNVFQYCTSLTGFRVAEGNNFYSTDDRGVLFNKMKTMLLGAPLFLSGDYDIPAGVESIESTAFFCTENLTSVTIPESVTYIGYVAFVNCFDLREIRFRGDAPKMEYSTFQDITTTVYYPANNATWTSAVRGNYGGNLTWIPYTPAGGESTGNACGDNVTWSLSGGTLTITGEGPMWDYSSNNAPDWSGVTAVEIRGNVTSVGANAFYNADSIETVHIYSDVTTIGSEAFADCSKLSYVKFPESLQIIEDMAFAGCTNLGSMHTGVTIPDSVTYIGDWAFRGCTYMSKLKLGSGVKIIGSEAFYGCEKLTLVSMPDTLTEIGAYAFGECYGLLSAGLSENLRAIPEGLFHNNTSLKTMTIPNSVKSVGDYAFYNCKNMSSVTVGGSVLEIGSMAFAECTGIHTMYFNGNAPKIAANAMKNVTANVYYFELDETWDEDAKQNYGGELTWMPSRSISHITTDTSEYRSEMYIKIKPVDPDTGKFLDGVTVESLFGENSVDYPYFDIGRGYAEQKTMVFSKSDYRDYVIPTEVSASWKGYNQAAYSHNAYMLEVEKENEPYISTVFGRFSGEDAPYVDLQHTRLEVLPNQGYDIIITACGLEGKKVTYYIGQEGNGGVASSNGVFSSEILHSVLRENDTVLAYAVVDNKRVAEVELELRKTAESSYLADFLGGNENLSLLGEDALKVTIDKSVPVLGGTEIDFSAFTMPFGIEMDDNKVKISIGINVFETKNEGKGSEIQKWDAFKELVIDHSDGWSDAQEAIDKYKKSQEAFKAFCAKEKLTYAGWFDLPKHVDRGFNAGIVGYLECEERNGQLVVTEGKISINGEFSFEYVAQGSVWVVPTYGALDLKAKVGGDGLITQCLPESTIPFAMTWTVRAEPELTVRSGVGIKDAASAGLYGTGSLPITLSFTNETLTIDLKGKWGVEAELFTMQGEKTMWEGEMKLVDWHFGAEPEAVCLDAFETTTVTTVASRDYAETTSQWLRSENQTMSLAADMTALDGGVTFEKLQTSIFANSQPQMVTVGDRMLLTWIQDAPDRDSYNRMRLVYSVYDPTFNTWSEPAAVWDDGHNDGYPRMVSNGQTAWVLWQKVNTTLTEENSNGIDAILENTELCLARFDLYNGLFSEQQMLTDNDLFEYAHSLNLVNGNPSVCWATAENNALNVSGCHTLTNWKGGFGETIGENLNYLLSVDAMEGQVTYVMDADGNLETVRDVTAFTVTGSGTTVFDNSENGKAITYAAYGSLNGEPTLFLSDMSNVCYQENGQWKKVFPVNRSMAGELNILKTDQGTTILWTETVQGWSELYSVSFRNGSWSEPVRISNNGERISQVSAVYINGRITGVCNTNKMVYDEITGEYAQEVADLSLFHISDFVDLALGQSLSVRESELKAGEETQLYVTVYNNGTKAVDSLSFTVSDTLGTLSHYRLDVQIPSGGSEILTVPYPVPENFSATTLTVEVQTTETDENVRDNVCSLEIGMADLSVTQTGVESLNGAYLVKALVENRSLVDAENVVLSVRVGEENADPLCTALVGSITRETYSLAEITLSEDNLVFDENGIAKVWLTVQADGQDAANSDNSTCVVLACGHSASEIMEVLEPTCTEQGYTTYTCANCGHSYVDDYVAALDHGFSQWYTAVEPTCTEDGQERRDCIREGCGYCETNVIEAKGHNYENGECTHCHDPEYFVDFVSTSVSLGGNIAMHFYAVLSDNLLQDESAYVQFTYGNNIRTVPLSEGEISVKDGVTRYMYSCPITSKNMTDTITAQIYTANGPVGESQSDDVRAYSSWLAENIQDKELEELLHAMLNYGAAAQIQFNYKTNDLANSLLDEEDKILKYADLSEFEMHRSQRDDGIKNTAATMLLDSETVIRIYYVLTGDKTIEDYTFRIDGVEVEPQYQESRDRYYVELPNIGAHKLDEMHVFTVGDEIFHYGPMSYVYDVLTYDPEGSTIYNMTLALYNYSAAAEAYIK